MAKGKKTGGRRKGSRNRAAGEARDFVDRVEAYLRSKKKPVRSLVAMAGELLFAPGREKVWETLMAYRYGRPAQAIEHSGSGGEAMRVILDIPRPERERAS